MFLRELAAPEKIAFLSLARYLVAADGKLQAQEQTLLQVLAEEMGLELDAAEEMDYMEAVALFKSRRSKQVALVELIGVGYVDNRFQPGEIQLIGDLFQAFGVPESLLPQYEDWVKRMLEVMREGYAFIGT